MSIELAQSRVSKHAVGRRPAAVSEGLKMLPGYPMAGNPKTKDESEEDTLVGSFTKLGVRHAGPSSA